MNIYIGLYIEWPNNAKWLDEYEQQGIQKEVVVP
jgi:hypothetical protein